MNLQELRKRAEAATPEFEKYVSKGLISDGLLDFNEQANPATILALLDLIAQCKEALEYSRDLTEGEEGDSEYGCDCLICHSLAAIERFEGEK